MSVDVADSLSEVANFKMALETCKNRADQFLTSQLSYQLSCCIDIELDPCRVYESIQGST